MEAEQGYHVDATDANLLLCRVPLQDLLSETFVVYQNCTHGANDEKQG